MLTKVDTQKWIRKSGYAKVDTQKWIRKSGYAKVDTQMDTKWIRKSGYAKVDTQKWIRKSGYAKVDTQKWIRKSGYAKVDTQTALDSAVSPILLMLTKVDTQLANSGIEVTLIKCNIKFETEIKAKN